MSATRATGSSLMALAASMLCDEAMGEAPLRGVPKKPEPVIVARPKRVPTHAELAATIAEAKQIVAELHPIFAETRAIMEMSRQKRAERLAQRPMTGF